MHFTATSPADTLHAGNPISTSALVLWQQNSAVSGGNQIAIDRYVHRWKCMEKEYVPSALGWVICQHISFYQHGWNAMCAALFAQSQLVCMEARHDWGDRGVWCCHLSIGNNSPENRQSFSALHFWMTMSISFWILSCLEHIPMK